MCWISMTWMRWWCPRQLQSEPLLPVPKTPPRQWMGPSATKVRGFNCDSGWWCANCLGFMCCDWCVVPFAAPQQVANYFSTHSLLSYPLPSYPLLSYPPLSYPILSYLLISYPILSYPLLSYPLPSRFSLQVSLITIASVRRRNRRISGTSWTCWTTAKKR